MGESAANDAAADDDNVVVSFPHDGIGRKSSSVDISSY